MTEVEGAGVSRPFGLLLGEQRPDLLDQAAAEADRHRVAAAAGLQLREQVAHVRLDGLLGEEERLADLTVHEAL